MDDKLTNKDAITVLQNLQDWLYLSGINGGTSIQREAIDIAIKALEAEPHWIPVEQELPQKNGAYLVTAEGFPVSIKFYSADSYGWGEEWHRVITAWMPLPEPYKGVTE